MRIETCGLCGNSFRDTVGAPDYKNADGKWVFICKPCFSAQHPIKWSRVGRRNR